MSIAEHGLLEYPDGKLPFHVKNLMGPMETKCHSIRMKRAFVLLFFWKMEEIYMGFQIHKGFWVTCPL